MESRAGKIVNKVLLAGLGFVGLTREKASKLLKELTGMERIGKEEASRFVSELVKRGQDVEKKISGMVRKEVTRVLGKLDFASKEEIESLKRKVEELEAKLRDR